MKRFIFICMMAMLLGPAAAADEDMASEAADISPVTAERAPPRYADMTAMAARLSGWTPAAVADVAGILFEVPADGLPNQDALAEALLDGTRPFDRRAGLAAQALLRLAGWLEFGLIDQDTLELRRLGEDEAAMLVRRLQAALETGRIRAAIDESRPQVRDYDILRAEMLRVLALRPIWPHIDSGASLGPGDAGVRVDQLRARLSAEGLLSHDWREGQAYDTRLATAVRRYQGRVNLSPTGRLDQITLRQLNISPEQRIAQLRANLEQRRWRTRQLGYRHIWVNLADFRLEAWEDGQLAREHQVMIGGQASSTPEFSEEMQYIVLNPWWGLPSGSARPRFQSIRRNPRIVNDRGFRIFDRSGQAVSVWEVDWSRWGRDWPYRLSQPPGPTNPMGEVKFIFPNRYNVYIHDTIERDRFVRTRRDFSAGCIRVRDPLALASWVLEGQADWSRDRIDAVVAGNTPTVVWLDRRIPVHIAYWTVVGDADGQVRYLHDLYRRDGRVIDAYSSAFQRISAEPAGFGTDLSGRVVSMRH